MSKLKSEREVMTMMTKSRQREEIGPRRMIVMALLIMMTLMKMKIMTKSHQREVTGPWRMIGCNFVESDESSLMMLITMKMLTMLTI